MVFSSFIFLFAFMPVVLLACGIAKQFGKSKLRNIFLLLASLLFYAWGEPIYVFLMAAVILTNWMLGKKVYSSKPLYILTIIIDLGVLIFFKYIDMLLSTLGWCLHRNIPGLNIALPVGISFYIFQLISYIIDVRRGSITCENNLMDFATYVAMFPQLIAGPIVRYSDIKKEMQEIRNDCLVSASGMRRFCFGLGKKVLIANTLSEVADTAFCFAGRLRADAAVIGAAAYMLQIYYDFSGYSDMAIGLGKMLGFSFPENFNYPYSAKSVREFWRRWHISLSTWFRDYLYIPLGGNRKGQMRTLLNQLIVFALCGLWHGAEWSFLLWGVWHGLFLCLERIPVIHNGIERTNHILRWLYTSIVVFLGWILFRADSISIAIKYFCNLISTTGIGYRNVINPLSAATFAIGIIGCIKRPEVKDCAVKETVLTLAALAVLALSAIMLAGGTHNPFIYFRF